MAFTVSQILSQKWKWPAFIFQFYSQKALYKSAFTNSHTPLYIHKCKFTGFSILPKGTSTLTLRSMDVCSTAWATAVPRSMCRSSCKLSWQLRSLCHGFPQSVVHQDTPPAWNPLTIEEAGNWCSLASTRFAAFCTTLSSTLSLEKADRKILYFYSLLYFFCIFFYHNLYSNISVYVFFYTEELLTKNIIFISSCLGQQITNPRITISIFKKYTC